MKVKVAFTLDEHVLREIEKLRGRENRSTFLEHVIKLGLRVYKKAGKN